MSYLLTNVAVVAQNAAYSSGLSYSYTAEGEFSTGTSTTGTASVCAGEAGVHMALVPVVFSVPVPATAIGGTLTFTVAPQTGTVCDENDRFNIFVWALGASS